MKKLFMDRRSLLKGSVALGAAGAIMSFNDRLEFAKAWAADSPWKPEDGASLQLTRWKRFVHIGLN